MFFNTRGRPDSHVGIYVGQGSFVHAPSRATGSVRVSNLRHRYWRARLSAVRRPRQWRSTVCVAGRAEIRMAPRMQREIPSALGFHKLSGAAGVLRGVGGRP